MPVRARSLRSAMRRLRALMLLGTLLTNPVRIVAAVVFPALGCCCSGAGGMCPLHRTQKSQSEKTPCQGSNQSQQTSMCAPNAQAQSMVPQFAPKATMDVRAIAFLPSATFEVVLFNAAPVLIRSVSPPDQPPRQ